MTDNLQVSAFFPSISAERLYSAWLDGEQHAAFTGSPATVDPQVGGAFSAWEGYIQARPSNCSLTAGSSNLA
jgi:hypothetical protein